MSGALEDFGKLLRHTLVYGLGNYGVKVVGFLLIPLYTRYLTPTDYGVLALVSMLTQALFLSMNFGQSTALFRFYFDRDGAEDRERVIAASTWIVVLVATPVTLLLLLSSETVSAWLLGDPALSFLIAMATGTVVAKVFLRLPFSVMRAESESKRYATWSVTRAGLATGTAVVLVVVFRLGVTGVVLAQLLGEVTMCLLLASATVRTLRVGFPRHDVWEQLKFGLPLLPAGVAAFGLDLADRWFIKHYYSIADVGVYSLGYRLGEILAFVVSAFQLSWPVFLFGRRREPTAPRLYAQMTEYYVACLMLIWLGLSLFSSELVRLMAPSSYWAAARVVPIVSLAMVLDGVTFMANIGQQFANKMVYRTLAVCLAAAVNLALNVVLIPPYGPMGAAWATLLGFLVQAAATLLISQRLYHVPYGYGRLSVVGGAAIGLYCASLALPLESLAATFAAKAVLLAAYPAALFGAGLLTQDDVARARLWIDGRAKRVAARGVEPRT